MEPKVLYNVNLDAHQAQEKAELLLTQPLAPSLLTWPKESKPDRLGKEKQELRLLREQGHLELHQHQKLSKGQTFKEQDRPRSEELSKV